jgi:hypothetical protein
MSSFKVCLPLMAHSTPLYTHGTHSPPLSLLPSPHFISRPLRTPPISTIVPVATVHILLGGPRSSCHTVLHEGECHDKWVREGVRV